MQATADLVFERGVAGTSLDDVLGASGTSKSQIYHYFTDKNALTEAVIAVQTQRVLHAQRPYLEEMDTLDGLRAWCTAVVDGQRLRGCVGGCPVGSLASELADSSESARALLEDSFAKWQTYFEDGLSAMRARGDLDDDADPSALADVIMVALQGGLLLTQTTRSTRHLEEGLAMAVAHVERHVTPSHRGAVASRRL